MDTNSPPTAPMLVETPPDALVNIVREVVYVEGQSILLHRPDESDRLLDHPFVHQAFAKDEYMPYWTDLWPAARMLAKVIARMEWPAGIEALEVGCGLGLPGIVALARGVRVIFSDYDATALQFAANNARLNGLENFRLLQMDWRFPPPDLKVPVVLAADLIYEMRNVAPLVALIRQVMLPDGFCLLTDQDRVPSHMLPQTLDEHGLDFTTEIVRAGEPGGRRVKGTLYRIRHRH